MKKKLALGILTALLTPGLGTTAQAAQGWTFEITPYVWLAGINADITVGDRTGEVDAGFDDLMNNVDVTGGLLLTMRKDRWVSWLQGDFLSLDPDNEVTRFDQPGNLETDITIVEAATGYQFANPLMANAAVDTMIGLRYTNIENTFDAATGESFERSNDLFDVMLVLRPLFPITQNLAFTPTLSIGAGDSDLVYELQPLFQYQFAENIAARIGYRRLFYKVKDNDHEFDGTIHGFLVGLAMKF